MKLTKHSIVLLDFILLLLYCDNHNKPFSPLQKDFHSGSDNMDATEEQENKWWREKQWKEESIGCKEF